MNATRTEDDSMKLKNINGFGEMGIEERNDEKGKTRMGRGRKRTRRKKMMVNFQLSVKMSLYLFYSK